MKKILAYLLMICGVVACFFDGLLPSSALFLLQILGYISMPFFAQRIVEGFFLTRNIYRYFVRLALFAYLSHLAHFLICLLWPEIPYPARMNILFSWMIALTGLIGLEFLLSLPRDRIASMNLLNANQVTNSTRYDVIITSEEAQNLPRGLKVPKWPKSTFYAIALVLLSICTVVIAFLPLTMSLLPLFCVLVFYCLHRWKLQSRILLATIVFSAFAAAYTFTYYRLSGSISWEWTSLAGFLICLLIPEKRRRKSPWLYRALYLIYPVSIVITGILAALLF